MNGESFIHVFNPSYMRPCTPHYVITIDHAITFGRSFYSSSTIWQSVIGIIQTFVMDGGLTNAIHENLRTLLRRIMHMWSDAARQKTPQPGTWSEWTLCYCNADLSFLVC
jgi:hypothetical protein